MGQILHGCARTTQAVRRAIKNTREHNGFGLQICHQPQDRGQMEEAKDGSGRSHGAEKFRFHGFEQSRRSYDCGLS